MNLILLQSKLITVSSNTNILETLKLMTGEQTNKRNCRTRPITFFISQLNVIKKIFYKDNHIRHISVIDKHFSIVDVVGIVVEQQKEKAKQLKDYGEILLIF